ncbi:MAG TPA: 3-phosphoshikimate 1-carboxyvinyltransferase [Candidatus Acidoferrales bacterium]|jgi:3-phosphoshikimate 1-carboxyvinyltransferase|nr:3-phosphoshikimate 1-carboxyvinyltransferase [Candidatus Acidoferrales bacterium]
MSQKVISPGGNIDGVVELPGDKSISHRYAIIAALAEGKSEISNYASAADCRSTLECLRKLGVEIEHKDRTVLISGVGLNGLTGSRKPLDAQNSGSTMRMLAGVLAGQPFKSSLTGDDSLRRRPMKRVIEPLRQMGAQIDAREGDRAPLEIHGGNLHAIDYTTPVPSAQVKSAILFAGLFADDVSTVRESVVTRDHTEVALREFGANLEGSRGTYRIHPRPKLTGRKLVVPGDLSGGVFLIAAALVAPESSLMLHNVGINPSRAKVIDFFISIGAPVHVVSVTYQNGELVGDIAVRHAPLKGGSISGPQVAEMIDELPMLAALGPFTEEGIEIHDAKELRVKESDRIATIAEGLRAMGAQVDEFPDGMRVAGQSAGKLRGAKIDPHGDHRIAMALSVVALGAEGDTVIRDADCVGVSFPEFFPTLERLRGAEKPA